MEIMDASIILNFYFYLKINKILKYILLLNIYINIVISRIIVNKITKAGDIININRDNINNIYIN